MLHRHARPAVAGAFLFGSLCGALLTSTTLIVASGLLSPVPLAWRAGLLLSSLVLLALHQARILCLDLPQRAWQIPPEVFRDDPRRAAFRFAMQLGSGVRTYITTAAPYAAALAILLVPPAGLGSALLAALLLAVGYGTGRAVIVVAQLGPQRIAVEHPTVWLEIGAWLSIGAAALIAVRALGAA